MKKPKNRKERIEFLHRKKGEFGIYGMEYLTDREVKNHFEKYYPSIKDAPDYIYKEPDITCCRCGCTVFVDTTYECQCGINKVAFSKDEV